MFSYLESRGGDYQETLFFGLQYLLEEYLTQRVTMQMVDDASEFFRAYGEPFNYDGWEYIVKGLDGKLPIRIRAVPEGTWVPTGNALLTVESTDEQVPWVVSYLEDLFAPLVPNNSRDTEWVSTPDYQGLLGPDFG